MERMSKVISVVAIVISIVALVACAFTYSAIPRNASEVPEHTHDQYFEVETGSVAIHDGQISLDAGNGFTQIFYVPFYASHVEIDYTAVSYLEVELKNLATGEIYISASDTHVDETIHIHSTMVANDGTDSGEWRLHATNTGSSSMSGYLSIVVYYD